MKIALLVNYDAAAALALHCLSSGLSHHDLRVFYTDKTSNRSTDLSRLAAFDRAQVDRFGIFNALAAEKTNDINGADLQRWQNWAPDLAISIRHMSILKTATIAVPKRGVINLHSGLLPHYQGVMATFWAMLNQESQIGTTLHFIEDASIDTGEVIARTQQTTQFQKSYFWNVLSLYQAGCDSICTAVESMSDLDQAPASTPQQGKGSYYTFPTAQDLAAFQYPLFMDDDSLQEFVQQTTTS